MRLNAFGRRRLAWRIAVIVLSAAAIVAGTIYGNYEIVLSGAAILGFIVFVLALVYVQANANWRTHKLMQVPFEGDASTMGLHFKTVHSESRIPWGAFYGFKDTGDAGIVLVYQSRMIMHMFPRRFFASDADWIRFRALVNAHCPSGVGRDALRRLLLTTMIWVLIILVVIVVQRVLGH